jgi:UDP-N-acetylenolpyruvoylglucosamine reductase
MSMGAKSNFFKDRIAEANAFAENVRPQLSPGAILRLGEPLARRTTFRVGGPADVFAEPACTNDLGLLLRECSARSRPFLVLGRGSNLLVRDGGFAGVVISLEHPSFSFIRQEGTGLRCGAGARLKQVAHDARRLGIGGLEFFEGIPGSVGGALRMNAGAMGSSAFDRVQGVQYMTPDGRIEECEAAALKPRYRSCDFFTTNIALSALLAGYPAPVDEIANRMAEFSRKRWSSQPAAASAGCMFKNPSQIPAGKLIDELGLKGSAVGGAAVSLEHGNFLVNKGTATASDIIGLIEKIRDRARNERGIELELEVKIIGND